MEVFCAIVLGKSLELVDFTGKHISKKRHWYHSERWALLYVLKHCSKCIWQPKWCLKSVFFLSSFLAAAWLPGWTASWHCHAPKQRHLAAACIWASQQRVFALALPAHQDLFLCTWRIPYTTWWCPTSELFCLLWLPGGSERWHGPGHPGSVCTECKTFSLLLILHLLDVLHLVVTLLF